jgi:hypothetical protein
MCESWVHLAGGGKGLLVVVKGGQAVGGDDSICSFREGVGITGG